MKLSVGLVDISPEWRLLLQQIGVAFKTFAESDTTAFNQYPVWILSATTKTGFRETAATFLQNGGAVLTEAQTAKRLFGLKTRRRKIRYISSTSDKIFDNMPICRLNLNSSISNEARHFPQQSGKATVAILSFGKGRIIVLPTRFAESVLIHQSARINFPSHHGERLPSERVSAVSKGNIRRIVQSALAYLFHFRQLPFVRLWPFPNGAKNLFGFRIDTDFGTREEINALYDCCRKFAIPATWFVETKSCANWLPVFAEMKEQEIAYHCYRHRIFSDDAPNRADMAQGLTLLKKSGILPRGYAAPYGEWHPAMTKIVLENKFEYASEFSMDYDNLPFYPFSQNTFSDLLQVPIHPVSVGRLHWARHSESQMIDYYQDVLAQKIAAQEPVFFYHHPGQQRLNVLEHIFKTVNEKRMAKLSFGEYADWWKQRKNLNWQASYTNGLKLETETPSTKHWICAVYPDQKTYIHPLKNTENAESEKIAVPTAQYPKPFNAKQLMKYTKQMLLHDFTWHYGKSKQ